MHISSLVEVHWCLLKLSSGNEKQMDGRTMDGQTDRHTDLQRETIIPCHYCVEGYKKKNEQIKGLTNMRMPILSYTVQVYVPSFYQILKS